MHSVYSAGLSKLDPKAKGRPRNINMKTCNELGHFKTYFNAMFQPIDAIREPWITTRLKVARRLRFSKLSALSTSRTTHALESRPLV